MENLEVIAQYYAYHSLADGEEGSIHVLINEGDLLFILEACLCLTIVWAKMYSSESQHVSLFGKAK